MIEAYLINFLGPSCHHGDMGFLEQKDKKCCLLAEGRYDAPQDPDVPPPGGRQSPGQGHIAMPGRPGRPWQLPQRRVPEPVTDGFPTGHFHGWKAFQ